MAKRKPLVSVGGRIVQLKDEDTIDSSAVPSLRGDTAPFAAQTKTYTITNFSSFSTYSVTVSAGSVSINGDTITLTTPSVEGILKLTLFVDNKPTIFNIDVQAAADYIAVPTPTPNNFGDPLEGGFYAGMIWNQLVQSNTTKTIATGPQIFVVPNMTGAPIVYRNQLVEVRSRANPANKMIGVVTGALGTNLTINVTTIEGTGSFSDWSIMARYRVIISPKASGEHAGIALKNAATLFPTACRTASEGYQSTVAMYTAGDAVTYPAAHWAKNLTINGYTDWYIPSRDELELLWRNLKPTTDNNYTGTRGTANADFKNRGAYADTSGNVQGLNLNSYPTSDNYTTTNPTQVLNTAFRVGGTEAISYGAERLWSSSESSDTIAWFQHWHSEQPGGQSTYQSTKNVARRVRAVRRSII